MIGFLSGPVQAVHKNYLIVVTGNIGYRVFVTPQVLLSAEDNQKIELHTHTYVREDQLALYGFPSLGELDFFELLISVSGIGPKSALGILSVADLTVIKSGIASGDASVFTKVSGIGRKTAERLIVELKEKIVEKDADREKLQKLSQDHANVLDVLLALGYSRREAQEALAEIPKGVSDSNDKVREALRALAKQ